MKIERLSEIDACRGAKEWAKSYADLESAWLACDRGDRMAWYLRRVCKTEADKRKVVGVLAEIVGTVIHLTTDQRVRDCLEACKAYARGVDVDLRSAYAAAHAAYAEATTAEATDAAYAAACATSCATAADDTYAAAYASCAAYAAHAAYAATAEDASVYASTRTALLKRSADIVRKHYPTIPSI